MGLVIWNQYQFKIVETELEITANRQEIAYDPRKSRVSVSNLKKAGKVMTADHHDQELWERYFKPCKNTNLQLAYMYRMGLQ
jgi:hypothetical protein